MDQALTYDLSFSSLERRPRKAPEIVFIIDKQHMPEAVKRLDFITERLTDYADDYLGGDMSRFTLPVADLFGNKEFGYAKCGYWTTEDSKVYFRLQLRPPPWTYCCSLTILVLTHILGYSFNGDDANERTQDVSLFITSNKDTQHGHAISGKLSKNVITWLKTYANKNIEQMGVMGEGAPMHPEVIQAQQSAAGAMIKSQKEGYVVSSRYINGLIRKNGSFILNCFGDACDLGIYPDQYYGKDYDFVEFGCHNLDHPRQQLTLLSGLAKICQLARESS